MVLFVTAALAEHPPAARAGDIAPAAPPADPAVPMCAVDDMPDAFRDHPRVQGNLPRNLSTAERIAMQHAGWFSGVRRQVYARWQPPAAGAPGARVTVAATVDRTGAADDLCVVTSSGVPALDRSALDAFAAAVPLEPPSALLTGPDGLVRFWTSFTVAPDPVIRE